MLGEDLQTIISAWSCVIFLSLFACVWLYLRIRQSCRRFFLLWNRAMWNPLSRIHRAMWKQQRLNATPESGPFLNMRSCLYLCSCGLVKRHQSSPKYCSNSKFTSSQVQLKSPDVSLLRPFYQGCIQRWFVRTWGSQVSQNAFRTNQPAFQKPAKFQNRGLCATDFCILLTRGRIHETFLRRN